MFNVRRRTAVTVTAVVAACVAAGLAVTLTAGNGQAGDRDYIGGGTSAWLYAAGHRPVAPDFSGTTLTGSHLSFSSYKGKAVVLNFWGSWCGPCRGEAPTLAVLSQKYAKDGVSFIGDDVQDTPTNALAFARSTGIKYPSLNDPGYQVAQDFGQAVVINETPTTVVIDPAGRVAGVIYGTASYGVLNTMLRDVVKT
ncbi:MAG: TlpA family protein disulfide reductase [Nocardiopsaceae bacterium]|nr:TlpA family protein disulfide reductase [Nocardiopsaceae bacterium]